MKFKYALRGIIKEDKFAILLIFQIAFAFYALYNTLEIQSQVNNESSKIFKYFGEKKIYNLQMDDMESMDEKTKDPKINEESLKKTFDAIENSPAFDFSHQVLFPITIEVFKGCEDLKVYPPESELYGKKMFQARNITVGKNVLSKFDIKLTEGRSFNDDEYERSYGDNHPLPILVGANFGKHFKVGDVIDYFRSGPGLQKAKIIGIISEDQYIPVSMTAFDSKRYVDLNNSIITSYAMFDNYKILYETMFDYNFLYFDEKTYDKTIYDINYEIQKSFHDNLGINVSIKDLNKYVKAELDTFKSQDEVISITSITIFLFISLTLIISRMNSIAKRKKEFGIHIFCGGTMRSITLTMYLETLLLLLTSFLISIFVLYLQNGFIRIQNILFLFLTLVIVSIITTILPILKLMKFGITDLIKEVD